MKKMKVYRYAGNCMTAFFAVVYLIFTVFPLFAVAFVINTWGICFSSVCLIAMLLAMTATLCAYYYKFAYVLFAWCCLEKEFAEIICPLKGKYIIEYSKCRDIGVGFYVHGFANKNTGIVLKYIYLSQNVLSKSEKSNINLLKISDKFIKIGFRQGTYRYLINNLPVKQAQMLEKSYLELTK